MKLSRVSIRRPVLAAVANLLLVVFGVGTALQLPVREYPDIDPPVISVTTNYLGASAEVVDQDVTEPVEEGLSSIDGIELMQSTSRDEVSTVELEFTVERDLEAAAADVRDALGRIAGELPEAAEDPVVLKASGDASPILWITLTSQQRDRLALSDYADRNLVDPLSVVPGVARVIIGGERRYAMRIWLDPDAMAQRGVTPGDVTARLEAENVELPAGRLTSHARELTLRTTTRLASPEDFRQLVLRQDDGYLLRLGEVARVELGAETDRTAVRVDGAPAVGLGVVRQSDANTVAVTRGVLERVRELEPQLPDDIRMSPAYDASVFIEGSIREVLWTLAITGALVLLVMLLTLRSVRVTLIPALTIPISLIATGGALYAFDYSLNTLTLLALVLAIGLVVDDAIVVVEAIVRRHDEGEDRLLAAARGADEVGLAVIATTAALIAVFVPLGFLPGDVGRLFTEFGLALAAAVAFSSFAALTVGPSLAARLLRRRREHGRAYAWSERVLERTIAGYRWLLRGALGHAGIVVAVAGLLSVTVVFAFRLLPRELAPSEDRGLIVIPIEAPDGASFAYTLEHLEQVEELVAAWGGPDGPVDGVISIIGLAQEGPGQVDEALVLVRLKPWDEREVSQQAVSAQLMPRLLGLPGVQAFAVDPPSFGQGGFAAPVRFVIGAPDFESARRWGEELLAAARGLPALQDPRLDYSGTRPQLRVSVDRTKAADLGVSAREVGQALQTLFAEQEVGEFVYRARAYDVIPQAEGIQRVTPAHLEDVHVRAATGELVPLDALVELEQVGAPNSLRRVDRLPSVTISASLAPGVALGEGLAALTALAERELPDEARFTTLGLSREFEESAHGTWIAFGLAFAVIYLVLAAQFESWLDPFTILAPVPLAATGGLLLLWVLGRTFNIYSQVALILLIGLMAKNSILVVELANQLRDQGRGLYEATLEGASLRLRPVVMTSISTAFGALPLLFASGPGAEGRVTIGAVVLGGITVATALALLVVPTLYLLLGRFTKVRGEAGRRLAELEVETEREPATAGAGRDATRP